MAFEPQNELERALVDATRDAAARPRFYQQLVQSEVFIIQHGAPPPRENRRVTLQEGTKIQIANIIFKDKPHIPLFSSLPRLKSVLTDEVAYLGLNGLELLKMTQGAPLILNPGSDFGKEITVEEAAAIIDGSIWRPIECYVAEKAVNVLIGQPKRYPQELVDALVRLFKTKRTVKRAWVAQFFNPERNTKPHTLIAIEADAEFEQISAETGLVAQGVKIPDPPVDVLHISGGGGIEDYFLKSAEPFYSRRFLGLF